MEETREGHGKEEGKRCEIKEMRREIKNETMGKRRVQKSEEI